MGKGMGQIFLPEGYLNHSLMLPASCGFMGLQGQASLLLPKLWHSGRELCETWSANGKFLLLLV